MPATMINYDKIRPSRALEGGVAVGSRANRDLIQPEALARRGRRFYCLTCSSGSDDGALLPVELVIGDNVNGWWHKGHIAHRVVTE